MREKMKSKASKELKLTTSLIKASIAKRVICHSPESREKKETKNV